MKINKYEYLWVVQGNYGYGWDDLTYHELLKEARRILKDYDSNEKIAHRLIHRRILNTKLKET